MCTYIRTYVRMYSKMCAVYLHMFVYSSVSSLTAPLTETSGAFVKKLQSVCSLIPSSSHFQPVLSSPGTAKLMVGTWILQCVKEGQLHILNTDGTRVSPVCVCVCVCV